MTPQNPDWHSQIEAPLKVSDEGEVEWTTCKDVVIVGLGGAGVACALQALELGQSVIALDRFEGGGATSASGGVIYAGGGTEIQKAAGVEDTSSNMFNYLKQETNEIVSDECLKDFCAQSAPTIDWMREHGVDMRPTLWDKKTSYPAPEYFLYHSDNSLLPHYQEKASPAARGHRGYVPVEMGRKAIGLGGALFNPLKQAALSKGLEIMTYADVRQLVLNAKGRVIGVKIYQFQDEETRKTYLKMRARAKRLMMMVPPIIPGSKWLLRRAIKMLKTADQLEASRDAIYIRAEKGVLLSAGGFIFNSKMLKHYAPKYTRGYPLGTEGDNGAGIRLGQSVGGYADNMDRVTTWRFINPPLSFAKGMIVNMKGQRFINEMVYGATLGVEMTEHHGGDAWMILDKKLVKDALFEVSGKKALMFQKALAHINVRFGSKKAKTIEDLARKIGVPPEALKSEIENYNASARGETMDPFHKKADDQGEIKQGPFYAINVGIGAKLMPCSSLTLGGLKVDETTGQVKNSADAIIEGLYAAGRNAVGVASWNYVSGLSIADGIYSGRRAARAISAASLIRKTP